MFCLSTLKDTVGIIPSSFSLEPEQAILRELNKKYANRVVHDIGLAICVFDLVYAGEGIVRYGDGCYWHKVTFRLVMFRPFRGETLIAKVKSSTEDAIRLSLGFFDDIYITPSHLPSPSAFDPNERLYFWNPSISESSTTPELLDTPLDERNYIETGEWIRVHVESDEFHDDEPGPPKALEGVPIPEELVRRAPYRVTCSIVGQGLGMLSWWEDSDMKVIEE